MSRNNETQLKKIIHRVNEFDDIMDNLCLDKGLFYKYLDPAADFFIGNTLDISICFWAHDINNVVIYGNSLFMEKFSKPESQPCYECLMGEGKRCDCCQSRRVLDKDGFRTCSLCKRKDDGYDINVCHISMKNRYGNRLFLKTSFHVDDAKEVYERYYARKKCKLSE